MSVSKKNQNSSSGVFWNSCPEVFQEISKELSILRKFKGIFHKNFDV